MENLTNEVTVIIGLGGAGSTITTTLNSKLKQSGVKNVETYLFNSSKIDMQGMGADQFYILYEQGRSELDSQGCGKDRELGKKIAGDNEPEIQKFCADLLAKKIEAIHIIFSSGGGTGSGFSSIFINIIKHTLGKLVPIFVHMIKPFDYETIPSVNSINNLTEIASTLARKEIVFNLIDNNIVSKILDSTDFIKINDMIVDNILLFCYDYISSLSQATSSFSLDRRDFYRIISQRGNSAGLVSVYGYKKNEFTPVYNFSGIGVDKFEGARKVLCILKDSKFIKDVQHEIKKLGETNVLEFKTLNFDSKIIRGASYDGIIIAVGEKKSDNLVNEMVNEFNTSIAVKDEMKKKDEIKADLKERGVKKVKIKF